jgi:glycosyltransferase involved in cell wall biosynthesis
MTVIPNHPGLSIIVTSYERMISLHKNLTSLMDQEMGDIPIEIVVVNNSSRVTLHPTRWTKIGRLFRQYPNIKLINSQHNWRIYFRYGIAYFALYDTILYMDDDIYFQDSTMLRHMYDTLMGLSEYDIVSCWNMLWTRWTDTELSHVSASLLDPDLTKLTKTDTSGPGISMFNKKLILDARAQRHVITWDIPDAGDYALGLLSQMLWGGTTYAIPAYKRVGFSEEFQKGALHIKEPNFVTDRMRLFKEMFNNGYIPAIKREQLAKDSPEQKLINRMQERSNNW